jgi:hypothetical protein
MRNKKSVLMTLNHNCVYFSGVGSGITSNGNAVSRVAKGIFGNVLQLHARFNAAKPLLCAGRCYTTNVELKNCTKVLLKKIAERWQKKI